MINLTNKIIILTICLVSLLSGCAQKKEPINWDVSSEDKWEIYGTGEITELKFVQTCSCSTHGDTRKNWCREAYSIRIDNEEPVLMNRIKDPGTVKVGLTGTLYKYNLGGRNERSLFQWIGQEIHVNKITLQSEILEEKQSTIEFQLTDLKQKATNSIEDPIDTSYYQWQDASKTSNLQLHEIVLVKLKNGHTTTGFITYHTKWKLGININKYNYGRDITDIIKWKKIYVKK